MGGDSDSSDEIDWNSDDEREIELLGLPPSSFTIPSAAQADPCASSSGSKLIDGFVRMGYDVELVAKVIKENGEDNTDLILDTLLSYSLIKEIPEEQPDVPDVVSDQCSSGYDESFLDEFSDVDSSENEKTTKLVRMGYSEEDASIALERCGSDASFADLTDFICVAQMAKVVDVPEQKPRIKKDSDDRYYKQKKIKLAHGEDSEIVALPTPMIGFGLPTDLVVETCRKLPEAAKGLPYFYYENVALAPKGVWQTISNYLYEVKPEFVDSKYFSAAARKRGYIHNLPIHNRFPLRPAPPQTIHEALPLTKRWWPSWDPRTKLNCLQTVHASAKLTERIRQAVGSFEGEPPESVKKFVLDQCRKWNLVWVGRNKVAPLEPDEVEMLLGFPKNHTRGGGISRTDRYKSLGNSFQVDTVAYHLSVLKELFPRGINLLSLFSGIGGAEVALHRLGVRLNNVVSVEISEANRNIMKCWWEQTNQTGNLIDIADVQDLDEERLEQLVLSFGGFDLVVGGSPCNNLAGSNRVHRDGLEGKESSLFFEYWRILDSVKRKMREMNE